MSRSHARQAAALLLVVLVVGVLAGCGADPATPAAPDQPTSWPDVAMVAAVMLGMAAVAWAGKGE